MRCARRQRDPQLEGDEPSDRSRCIGHVLRVVHATRHAPHGGYYVGKL